MTSVDRRLRIFAVCACLGTLAPLLLSFVGLFEMKVSFPAIALPSILLLLLLAVWVRKRRAPEFWTRFAIGGAAGLLATFVYDFARLGGLLLKFPGFDIIHKFGLMITGEENLTVFSATVGWLYHFSNGTVLGIIFCLIVGRAALWMAIAWGLILEGAMVASYPSAFGVDMSIRSPGLFFSFVGHLCYGLVLGILIRRWIPDTRGVFRAAAP